MKNWFARVSILLAAAAFAYICSYGVGYISQKLISGKR